jgi:hypothetical protein
MSQHRTYRVGVPLEAVNVLGSAAVTADADHLAQTDTTSVSLPRTHIFTIIRTPSLLPAGPPGPTRTRWSAPPWACSL